MKLFENKGMSKANQKLVETLMLAFLEYILAEGLDNALLALSGVTEDEVRVFPHLKQALNEKGLLK